MGSGIWRRLAIGLVIAGAGMAVWASVDEGEPPSWALAKPSFDLGGSAAMLLPSNDTRVNLYLLLADRRGARISDPHAKDEGPPLVLFPWSTMADRAVPASTTADPTIPASADQGEIDWGGPTRCQSNESGSADFIEAVGASHGMPGVEKKLLIAARQALTLKAKPLHEYSEYVQCQADAPQPQLAALQARTAREFAAYLHGAQLFYAGNFDPAVAAFRSLGNAADPWVRETALYMVARAQLNEALNRSLDEYGSLADPPKRDIATANAAGWSFQAYLAAYPNGRYANSARGLMRRVHWLAGDTTALAADFGDQIASPKAHNGVDSDLALVDELEEKLSLPAVQLSGLHDRVLLAVIDLQRMRQPDRSIEGRDCCGPPITRADIERQRPLFGNDIELFDYLRAAEAFFVRHQPAEVVQIIPDATRQQRFTYLQFSRQMLRGLALESAGDRNTRAFWLSLFPAATQPYQRGAIELALAMHDEHSGRLDLVFEPDSPVRHPIIRQLLLEHVAGPGLLRQQAGRADVPRIEREDALYMLLTKELRNDMYRPFVADVRLVPTDSVADSSFTDASSYQPQYWSKDERPPLGKFGAKGDLGDFGCPALTTTASQLASDPRAARPRLCLAEFFRENGFDDFGSFEEPAGSSGLASSRSLFPRPTPYSRLEVYKSIIGDPTARPDDRALALNRAIQCYAPVGNNSCGGKEVSLTVRRGWFNRLKGDYPQSRWAKELKYYW